jgi:hypothetical protein
MTTEEPLTEAKATQASQHLYAMQSLPRDGQALEVVAADDAETMRILSATNLDDSFCRACGYMESIPKMPPPIAILIAESERALAKPRHRRIADAQRERAIYKLNAITADLLG